MGERVDLVLAVVAGALKRMRVGRVVTVACLRGGYVEQQFVFCVCVFVSDTAKNLPRLTRVGIFSISYNCTVQYRRSPAFPPS